MDKAISQSVKDELDMQARKDLYKVLQTEEGRRFLRYLMEECGINTSFPNGNSKDIFNAGRRHVAVQLAMWMDSIDFPTRTSGVDLRLYSEKEYVLFKLGIYDKLQKLAKRKGGTGNAN